MLEAITWVLGDAGRVMGKRAGLGEDNHLGFYVYVTFFLSEQSTGNIPEPFIDCLAIPYKHCPEIKSSPSPSEMCKYRSSAVLGLKFPFCLP